MADSNMERVAIAKLEALPNLHNQIETLKQSKIFEDLGDSLNFLLIAKKLDTIPEPKPKEEKKPRKPITQYFSEFIAFLPSGKDALHLFAGAMVAVVWIAITALTLQNFALSWGWILALAIFWLSFPVFFRLMIMGILD